MSTTQSFQSSPVQLYPHQPTTSVRNDPSQRFRDQVDPLQRREYEAAIAHCDQVIACQPNEVEAWYERGQAQANLGLYEAAIASFNQALVLQPHHVAALVFRAVACIHLKGYEEALLSCNMALAVQPYNSEAWLYRGVALRYLNRYKEAYASYDSALGVRRLSPWRNLMSKISRYLPKWSCQS